ncbi:AMP-binding protein [Roseivirga sp.]|uniref:AMP-binding protein n=1 Tax=Roseivirga sp. TaxID=1964215 RepID=UPI003B8C28B9
MESTIQIDNHLYSTTEFVEQCYSEEYHWIKPAQSFVKDWMSGTSIFTIQTSGSTGIPKKIEIKRAQMIASAQATIHTLRLPDGLNALLCINTDYIGGKMMLLRALLGNWHIELIEPSMDPSKLAISSNYEFAAFVPLQVLAMTKHREGREFLNGIDQAIIGGAAISEQLQTEIEQLTCLCYNTYGMTETVSHIALKTLNGNAKSEWFKVLEGNKIDLDERSCLKIKGAVTDNEWVITNDIVELENNTFKWISRADLVANTGGIKVFIEQVESTIKSLLPTEYKGNILIWKAPDEALGEKLVGVCTDEKIIEYISTNRPEIEAQLNKYTFPKEWLATANFHYTESGKLDRQKTYENIP